MPTHKHHFAPGHLQSLTSCTSRRAKFFESDRFRLLAAEQHSVPACGSCFVTNSHMGIAGPGHRPRAVASFWNPYQETATGPRVFSPKHPKIARNCLVCRRLASHGEPPNCATMRSTPTAVPPPEADSGVAARRDEAAWTAQWPRPSSSEATSNQGAAQG